MVNNNNKRKRGYSEAFESTYNSFLSSAVIFCSEDDQSENIINIEKDVVDSPEYCDNQMDLLLMRMADLCLSISGS